MTLWEDTHVRTYVPDSEITTCDFRVEVCFSSSPLQNVSSIVYSPSASTLSPGMTLCGAGPSCAESCPLSVFQGVLGIPVPSAPRKVDASILSHLTQNPGLVAVQFSQ